MSVDESKIKEAVESVFKNYDKDNNGTLDQDEVNQLINDALAQMGNPKKVSKEDVRKFISTVDQNNDMKVSKEELFLIFKNLIASGSEKKK